MRKIIAITTLFLISLSSIAWAEDYPIPDTGQNICYDNSTAISCPSPGEPFYGQDAQYLCNLRSYTKLDENGNELPDNGIGWVMVRDNVTGLIWEMKNNNSYDIHDKDKTYKWLDLQDDGMDVQEDFIAVLNTPPGFGGFTDWRLPTVQELSSIVDSGITYPPNIEGPTIDLSYFSPTKPSAYWTSNNYAPDGWNAHIVWFSSGTVDETIKFVNCYVRAVRGEQSSNNFVDNGDGTVSDLATGLLWQQASAPETYIWEKALSYCENLSLAGYDDWRLPNRNELQSIVDYFTSSPSIDTTFFPDTNGQYLSSTTDAKEPEYAWHVSFSSNSVGSYYKSRDYWRVRAVRAGQCELLDTSTTTTVTSTTTTVLDTCPTESIYGEHSEEVELLRYVRDNVLSQAPTGQEIISLYYQWSPMIVKAMEEDEGFKEEVKEMIDGVLELITEAE